MTGNTPDDGSVTVSERRLPPVAEMAVATQILVIVGGVYVAAYLPQPAPLAFVPVGLLSLAALVLMMVSRSMPL